MWHFFGTFLTSPRAACFKTYRFWTLKIEMNKGASIFWSLILPSTMTFYLSNYNKWCFRKNQNFTWHSFPLNCHLLFEWPLRYLMLNQVMTLPFLPQPQKKWDSISLTLKDSRNFLLILSKTRQLTDTYFKIVFFRKTMVAKAIHRKAARENSTIGFGEIEWVPFN